MSNNPVYTKALKYTDKVYVIPGQYENGALYIGLYSFDDNETDIELYTDISVYIMPVLPDMFYVEKGSEQERFCKEQKNLFSCMDFEIKQGFNTYILYQFNYQ